MQNNLADLHPESTDFAKMYFGDRTVCTTIHTKFVYLPLMHDVQLLLQCLCASRLWPGLRKAY